MCTQGTATVWIELLQIIQTKFRKKIELLGNMHAVYCMHCAKDEIHRIPAKLSRKQVHQGPEHKSIVLTLLVAYLILMYVCRLCVCMWAGGRGVAGWQDGWVY